MTPMPPPPTFVSATAETLPVMVSGTEHPMTGRDFSIDEDSLLERIEAIEIEQILRALFQTRAAA